MYKSIGRIGHRHRLGFAALALALSMSGGVQAESPPAQGEGLSIPAFTMPLSELSSEAQNQAYLASLATPGDGTIPIPDDPKMVAVMRKMVDAMFEKSLPYVYERYRVETVADTIGGVEVIRVRPKGSVAKKYRKSVLINLHGGSFMVGWPSVALLDAVPVAALSGMEVITVHYRLYPEAVHPAALEDVTNVYRVLLKEYKAKNIGIFGGSAGGVLTLQAVPWLRDQGLPTPGAIAPLSAAFQTAIGDSAIWNFRGGFSPPGTVLVPPKGYLGAHNRRDWVPGTSPDDLTDYPPTLWLAGTRAPETSGVITGHSKMLKAGVASELYMIEGGWHTSYSSAPQTPESQDAMAYIARWFTKRLNR